MLPIISAGFLFESKLFGFCIVGGSAVFFLPTIILQLNIGSCTKVYNTANKLSLFPLNTFITS